MENDFEISERKLEDIVFEHLSNENYYDGLGEAFENNTPIKVYRQLNLGQYGIADIVVFYDNEYDGEIHAEIIELKKGIIDKNTLIQVMRYKAGLYKHLSTFNIDVSTISTTMIGATISHTDNFNIIFKAIDDLEVYTYDIGPKGVFLKSENEWRFTELETPKNLFTDLVCIDYLSKDQRCMFVNKK